MTTISSDRPPADLNIEPKIAGWGSAFWPVYWPVHQFPSFLPRGEESVVLTLWLLDARYLVVASQISDWSETDDGIPTR
jgi:hypothetical protein